MTTCERFSHIKILSKLWKHREKPPRRSRDTPPYPKRGKPKIKIQGRHRCREGLLRLPSCSPRTKRT
jgi:hypothetical protein